MSTNRLREDDGGCQDEAEDRGRHAEAEEELLDLSNGKPSSGEAGVECEMALCSTSCGEEGRGTYPRPLAA